MRSSSDTSSGTTPGRVQDSRPYFSLVIPAYNEGFRIAATISTAKAYLESTGQSWELIVVDDGSADDTLDAIKSSCDGTFPLRVISYKPNRGKGYAVRQGMIASRGLFAGFSDADLSAPLPEFAKLFGAMNKGYDVAIGSRAVKGSHLCVHQPFYRELGGKALNLIIRLLAVPGVHDTQCGFKLLEGDTARRIFSDCFINGWGFDVEVLFLARRMGCSVAEIGVEWAHAEGSKIHPFRAAVRVIADIIRMRLHKYDLSHL